MSFKLSGTTNGSVNLKKAEIYIYRNVTKQYFEYSNFPTNVPSILTEISNNIIIIDNLDSNFNPISISILSKNYGVIPSTEYRLISSLNDKINNTTLKIVNNMLSFSISIPSFLNLSAKPINPSSIKDKYLVGKIIILYDDKSHINDKIAEMFDSEIGIC